MLFRWNSSLPSFCIFLLANYGNPIANKETFLKKNSGLCPLWFSQLKLCRIPSTAHIFLRGSHLRFMVERPTVPRQNVSRIVSPLWIHGQWQNRAPPERIRQDEKETVRACLISGQGKFWSPTLNSHTPTFSTWLWWRNESVNHKS